jgi:hypothetical protein
VEVAAAAVAGKIADAMQGNSGPIGEIVSLKRSR